MISFPPDYGSWIVEALQIFNSYRIHENVLTSVSLPVAYAFLPVQITFSLNDVVQTISDKIKMFSWKIVKPMWFYSFLKKTHVNISQSFSSWAALWL